MSISERRRIDWNEGNVGKKARLGRLPLLKRGRERWPRHILPELFE
jgi:hypothetical protein